MPDGTTGLPSAQAEVYFGQIPGTNEGIILQTVFMQSNNKAYNRWAKVNLSTGTTIWGNFAAPVDLSAFAIPSVPANGTVNAYGLTLIPSGNKLLTTIFVNNVGYSRTADYEIKSDGTVYISGSSSWQQFMLPGLVSGTVQAYDYAYYSHDGGFYLETVAKNNSFYYRYIKPEGSVVSTVQNRSSATNWQQPILGSTIPGEGNIITYSYYVINEGNFLSQAIWKTSGGVFRTIRANQLQYPQEQYYAEYDYNNDGKTNLQDLIIMLQALFNP